MPELKPVTNTEMFLDAMLKQLTRMADVLCAEANKKAARKETRAKKKEGEDVSHI